MYVVLLSGRVHRSTGKAVQPLRLLCIEPALSVDSPIHFAAANPCCHPIESRCNLARSCIASAHCLPCSNPAKSAFGLLSSSPRQQLLLAAPHHAAEATEAGSGTSSRM